jgi:hypothetical protein
LFSTTSHSLIFVRIGLADFQVPSSSNKSGEARGVLFLSEEWSLRLRYAADGSTSLMLVNVPLAYGKDICCQANYAGMSTEGLAIVNLAVPPKSIRRDRDRK